MSVLLIVSIALGMAMVAVGLMVLGWILGQMIVLWIIEREGGWF